MNATALDNGGPDDIFGSSRSYGSSFCGGNGATIVAKARPTMISAKYRLKEERRKVLKISINKLKKIEDMESSLRRSVLINNTIKRLQREAKEEKLQKQQLNSYPRCYTPYKTSSFSKDSSGMLTSLSSKSLRQDLMSNDADKENTSQNTSLNSPSLSAESRSDSLLIASDLDMSRGCDEEVASLSSSSECSAPVSKKRSIDEVEDCDVQDVLSQFYLPPTPRMLTSIDDTDDEDEDVNVVDIDVPPCTPATPDCCKRPKLEISDAKLDVPSVLCDRLCLDERTLPADASATTKNLEDSEDIEVVLEDNEDVERRLLLCSGGTTISRTSVSEDQCWVNSRTSSGGSSCALLPSPSDMLVEEDCTVDVPDPSVRLSCSGSSPVLLPAQSNELSEHDSDITRLSSGAPKLSTVLSPPTGMDLEDNSATNHSVLHVGCVPTCNIQPPSDMIVEDSLPTSVVSHPDLRFGYSVPSSNVMPSHRELLVPVNATQSNERLRLDSSPSCALLPPIQTDTVVEESNIIGANKHQTLRLASNPFVANSFCGSVDGSTIVGNTANSCPPMTLDPSEQHHQYSCGHASIFGELQSVVFHSLIASLES